MPSLRSSSWEVTNRALAALGRLVLSVTFIVSGFAKLDDPVGMAYKLHDYAVAMGLGNDMHHSDLVVTAMALAVVEFCLGVYLLFGIRRNLTMYCIAAMMAVMTPLTLWIAVFNPVPECGCFGDMITMTGWQTFWKNVLLSALAVFTFRRRRHMVRMISEQSQWMVSMFSIVYAIALTGICLYRLPVIDFRPYHVGANLRDYQTNFCATDMQTDEDYTDSLINDDGYILLLVMSNLETARMSQVYRINTLYDYAQQHDDVRMVALAPLMEEEPLENWCDMNGAEYPILCGDDMELKVIIRSNPGLVVLHKGRIMAKWSNFDMPLVEDMKQPIAAQPWAQDQSESRSAKMLRLLLAYLLPLIVITSLDRLYAALRWYINRIRKRYFSNNIKTNTLQ